MLPRIQLICLFRPHAASEVYVTGTFDDWSKSQKLENTGSGFEKKVDLHNANEKIYYKVIAPCGSTAAPAQNFEQFTDLKTVCRGW